VKTLRARLGTPEDRESGVTLVEVLVAMIIFSIISTGVIYSMLSVLALTRDSRSIQVASNLAAQEIDLARAVDDLFTLLDDDKDVQLNGDTFHVQIRTGWVSDPAVDLVCGAGGGALRYKKVNVTVTWDNMQSASSAVTSYTVIDPKSRINDPTKGTILVSVLSATGSGADGVSVTASPSSTPNGATALTVAPAATDAQGCTYILKVVPGNYDVTVSRSGYVDVNQAATSTTTVGVTAGASASVGFQYDDAGDFTMTYISNYPSAGVKIPTNMGTSFLSTYGTFVSPGTTNNLTRTVSLHPFTAGYSVLAGRYVEPNGSSAGCVAVDPEEWPDVVEGVNLFVGKRTAPVATVPGGAVSTNVPMGVFSLKGGSTGTYLKAVSVDATPRCEDGMTYVFGAIVPTSSSTSVSIALPYGSWKLYTGTSAATQTTAVGGSRMTMLTRGTVDNGTNIVLLDPRVLGP
jgi:prepilin-type N-terminal cleavage/methylation domain-containing protein